MSALDQQNAIETSAFFAAIIWGLLRSFTFMRDPTGTRQDPEEQRRTADSVICDQLHAYACRQCSESTSIFGDTADIVGLAIAATRSRMNPKQELAFWYSCHAHAMIEAFAEGEVARVIAECSVAEAADRETWIDRKTCPCGGPRLIQRAEQR